MSRAKHRHAVAPPQPPLPAAPPPTRLDPWAWALWLAVVPLLVKCLGAPLGEPVAEDFDFLHRILFRGVGTLLDGGGSQAFWRPLAHQVYYATIGRLVLTNPLLVALLHVVLLGIACTLLYRVFRAGLEGPAAAIAASFPLLSESTRTTVAWPTQFVDVGLLLFSAVALHETSRRRLPAALAGLSAALLCKEVAVVTAVLMPLLPGLGERRERARWALAGGVVVVAWASAYAAVRHAAHLELPHGLEHRASLAATSLASRVGWALGGSLRADFSLPMAPTARGFPTLIAVSVLCLGAIGSLGLSRTAWSRFVARRAWIAWGSLWFLLASLSLSPVYPLWQPNRSQIGAAGLGLALTGGLAAAHPVLAVGLLGVRLVLLGIAPGPARVTSIDPPPSGAFMDFAQLTRLERCLRGTRELLRSTYPELPRGANVLLVNMPHQVIYAFGNGKALQVWYRDSTLRLPRYTEFRGHPDLPIACVVDFQPFEDEELVVIEPEAMRAQENAAAALQAGRLLEALTACDRADSLERDRRAVAFRAATAGIRSYTLENLGQRERAVQEARRALALHPHDTNARLVLAGEAIKHGDLDGAESQLDTLLADVPGQPTALKLRSLVVSTRAGWSPREPVRGGSGAP